MTNLRRNLIISPIGNESLHGTWLNDRPSRNFDVFLVYYGQDENFGRQDADYYLRRQGFKWELIDHLAREHRGVLERYDRIWCPDCDLKADTASVNRLFDLVKQHRLKLAQPAISGGEVSYEFLRKRPNVVLRYTPFVEVMCPIFTREAFFRMQPTFLESRSGWGLDLLWPRHFARGEMAVVDAVGVEHTGQLLRGDSYQKLAKLGVNPGEELNRIIAEHGGFNRRLHRKLVRGRIKLPAVWESPPQVSVATRLLGKLGFGRLCA